MVGGDCQGCMFVYCWVLSKNTILSSSCENNR